MSGGSHSPNLGLLDQEASMQNIDRLVEALEMEARESEMSKCRKLFSDEPSSLVLQVYQPPDPKEPSSSALQVYQPLERLRKLLDLPVKGKCHRIVPPSEVEVEFLKRTSRKYKKDAWQDILPWFGFSLTHSQPRSEGWLVDDFKKFSLEGHPDGYALDKQVWLVINQVQKMFEIQGHLGHGSNDKFSGGKFREGWRAIVRIVHVDFLARQATTRHEHEPLLLEARNAFTNTKVEWDSEKGELVREREALKEELNKAKEMAA
ncbi:hypothetical protein R1flu_026519 [Riccia fluitans]|uniref:Uncharacterized protein n=1 Tax=Riccia fluitans TaxID=41844 RepID=A0ABD1XJ59_9MARC